MITTTYVCYDCFGYDYALEKFINYNAESYECTFCGTKSEKPIAADFNLVMDLILSCVGLEWTDAVEELAWDSEDKQYIGETHDSADLLHAIPIDINNDSLCVAVIEALGDQVWCPRNPYGDAESEVYLSGV